MHVYFSPFYHCNCQVSSMWNVSTYHFNVPKIM